MKFASIGDCALLIDFADESSDSTELLQRALSAAAALERAKIPGVVEITSAYQTVALFVDRPAPNDQPLIEQISRALCNAGTTSRLHHREIEIPVCYDEQLALDATRVENETRLPFARIIELHSSSRLTVACIAFMPGFPYLAGLPAELRVPRLATPRTKVPAGSVAIANTQTGIYPFESPGGWNIIGRTPLRLFDSNKTPPALLSAGDNVRFCRITRDEFDAAIFSNEK